MAVQVTKLTNILPSVQDAFPGLMLSKHEEARYTFPRVFFLGSFDQSNCAPSRIMQALNVLVVFSLAVVLPVTPCEVPDFWCSYLRPFADAGLAVDRTVAVRGAQETPDAMWDPVALDDRLGLANFLKSRDHAFHAFDSAGQSADPIRPVPEPMEPTLFAKQAEQRSDSGLFPLVS